MIIAQSKVERPTTKSKERCKKNFWGKN